MISWSGFCRWYNATKAHLPAAERRALRAIAIDRLTQRLCEGVADAPLDFADLVTRGEDAIAPR